jgi:hypothetical protein
MIIICGILLLFIYITRLASNEIFSPSNKIHLEVGRTKDLSAPLHIFRTSYVHHQEDYIVQAALCVMFSMHLCKQSTRLKDVLDTLLVDTT